MRVDTLEAYNVAHDILAIWRERVGENLLPVQERAVKEFGLFGDANLIVFSPTSSGKTFIGEMAAVRAARGNTKVFYLVPQKALAEEKYEELRARYQGAGIDVVVSSRDRREFDDAIAAGRFQIAVVVFEKLGALLVSRPQMLESVGLVVIDELQLITDENRGPALELLLTKLKLSRSKPRIVGLSAVLGKAQILADWLDAKLLVDTRRPVELRKGVACKGEFLYREHNSGKQGTEPFTHIDGNIPQELVLGAAEDIVRRGEQVLVFVADRASTVTCARVFADRVNLAAAPDALEEVKDQEETHAREALRFTLGSAVAFHNADLSPEERSLVERHFRTGAIRALFSTSTLAMGMNLPVRNVVLEGQKWHFDRYRRWGRKDISRSEYENMSGRAGRLGFATEYGRSILVTHSPFQADVWLRFYAEGDFEEIVPTLKDAPMEDLVVDLLASGMGTRVAELRELLMCSFTGATYWRQKLGEDELIAQLDLAIERCVQGGMATHDGDDLTVTRLGRACASKGIGVATGTALAQWAKDARLVAFTELEVILVAALTKAGGDVHITLNTNEFNRVDYKGELLRRAQGAGAIERPVFAKHAESQWAPEYEDAKAFKKALLLCDWIDEVVTRDIEERYQVWAGAIRRIGEELSWIVEALGAVATACGWPDERKAEIDALSDRLLFGSRADVVPLAKLRVRGMGRVMLRRLANAGLTDEAAIVAAGVDAVRGAVNHRGVFERLWARVTQGKPGLAKPESYPVVEEPTVLVAAEPQAEQPVLVVDLQASRVVYRGHEIPTRPPNNLQRQPLLALAVLASRPGEVVSMDELAEGMFKLGGLRKRPVAPEAREMRYRILRPIKKALDGIVQREELDHLVETVPGRGMRVRSLSLVAPESVRMTG